MPERLSFGSRAIGQDERFGGEGRPVSTHVFLDGKFGR